MTPILSVKFSEENGDLIIAVQPHTQVSGGQLLQLLVTAIRSLSQSAAELAPQLGVSDEQLAAAISSGDLSTYLAGHRG